MTIGRWWQGLATRCYACEVLPNGLIDDWSRFCVPSVVRRAKEACDMTWSVDVGNEYWFVICLLMFMIDIVD